MKSNTFKEYIQPVIVLLGVAVAIGFGIDKAGLLEILPVELAADQHQLGLGKIGVIPVDNRGEARLGHLVRLIPAGVIPQIPQILFICLREEGEGIVILAMPYVDIARGS